MKWLIILGLVIVVTTFLAVRFRRQIQMALQIWKMFRSLRQGTFGSQIEQDKSNSRLKDESPRSSALVRCSSCSKWIPENEGLNVGKKAFYCSTNCLEKAVRI
jgi:hypothetical protein